MYFSNTSIYLIVGIGLSSVSDTRFESGIVTLRKVIRICSEMAILLQRWNVSISLNMRKAQCENYIILHSRFLNKNFVKSTLFTYWTYSKIDLTKCFLFLKWVIFFHGVMGQYNVAGMRQIFREIEWKSSLYFMWSLHQILWGSHSILPFPLKNVVIFLYQLKNWPFWKDYLDLGHCM